MQTQKQIQDWLDFSRTNGIARFHVANYQIAKSNPEYSHLPNCEIPNGEGTGTEVSAYGRDELGNIVALLPDGTTKQFYVER